MKVLVTGSRGFLGSRFIRALEHAGIPHVAFDRTHPERVPLDVDAVVHFSGLVQHCAPKASLTEYREANVEGTRQLLDALTHTQVRRFVNIGTAAEYGFSSKPIGENAAERPAHPYGKSKLEQSRLVADFARTHHVKTINLRIFNIIEIPAKGTARRPSIFDSLIAKFDAGPRGPITIDHAQSVRDYVDLDDCMEAILAALHTKKGGEYEVVNIGSGHGTNIAELAAIFGKLLCKTYTLKNLARNATRSVARIDKAKELLGWQPKTPLVTSIKKLLRERTRVIFVGAGEAARQALAEVRRMHRTDIIVVGLVDDNPTKQGKKTGTATVLGTIDELPRLVRENEVDQVLIAMPSVGKDVALRLTRLLPPGFPIRVIPSASSVLLDRVRFSLIRPLEASDLVGRPLIKTDQAFLAKHAKGKTFLVAGAAGSIGSEIVRQLMSFPARRVIAVDSWEEGMFHLTEEWGDVEKTRSAPRFHAHIGNIRDKARMNEIIAQYSIDTILHAAAYKHVPLMETNEEEALKTNVGGTRNLLEAAVRHNVRDFVLISTDKAVHPTSVMGKTKRAAELLLKRYAKKHPSRRFITVRFGNVLNSSGSVIPKFMRQIENRLPITLTHRDMTRYFMSTPEAVSLVLMARITGMNGQTLVLDMGEPVRIADIADRLIRMHGLEPGRDIPIIEVGIRPGEKLHEELSYKKGLKPSGTSRIYITE